MKEKANVALLYTSKDSTKYGLLFMGLLGLDVALIYLYWVQLNIFQFLGYGCILGLLTTYFGRKVLVLRYNLRLKEQAPK